MRKVELLRNGGIPCTAKRKVPVIVETIIWVITALILFLTFLLWVLYGRTMYEGVIFYESATPITSYKNLTFDHIDGNSYEAKLFGIFPMGTVTIQEREREYVIIPSGGVLCGANVAGGELVVGVVNGSPAQKAGLRVGDIISKIDDIEVRRGKYIPVFEPDTTYAVSCTNGKVLDITTDANAMMGYQYTFTEPVLGTISFVKDNFFYAYGHTVGELDYDYGAWQVGLTVSHDDVYFQDYLSEEKGSVISYSPYGVLGIIGSDWEDAGYELPVAWFWEIEENAEVEVLVGCEDGSWTSYTGIVSMHSAVYTPDDPEFKAQYNYQIKLTDGNIFKAGLSGSPVIQNGKLVGVLAAMHTRDSTIGYFYPAEYALDMFQNQISQFLQDMQS